MKREHAQSQDLGRLGLFFAANILFGAGLFAHAFLYNFYLDGLSLGEGVMGAAAASLTAGGITALVPAGIVVDRVGARPTYLGAATLGFVGLVLGALATQPWAIYGAAFLAGAGAASWRVVSGPLLMKLARGGMRARAFSWNVALLVGSGAVWTAASGVLPQRLEAALGWSSLGGLRGALLVGATGTLMAGLVFAGIRLGDAGDGPGEGAAPSTGTEPVHDAVTRALGAENGRIRPSTSPRRTMRSALLDALADLRIPGGLVLLVVLVFVWMTSAGLVLPFFNIFFQREHGMPVDQIGFAFGTAQALTALVIFGSGELASRLGPTRALTGWMLLFAPALWALSVVEATGLAIGLFLFQGLVPPATNPLIDQVLLERAPEDRHGAVSSWRNAATESSGFVGATVGGVVLEALSFVALFTLAAGVALVGALGLIVGLRRFGRPTLPK